MTTTRAGAVGDRVGEAVGVEGVRAGVDVGEARGAAEQGDDLGVHLDGEGGDDHLVAGPEANLEEGEEERAGARAAGDGVADAAVRRELGLESSDLGAEDVLAGPEDADHGLLDLVLEATVLLGEVDEGDGAARHGGISARIPPMKRSLPAPWLAAPLAVAAVLVAAPARAQYPQPVQPAPPWPPYAQPLPPPPPSQYVAVWPPPAYAQPTSDVERRGPLTWYGWQTLLAVAPFDIAMFAGLARFGDKAGVDAFVTGFVGRNLAPAVVHMAHGRVGTGFASIGLHAATTATGVAIGYGIGIALESKCHAPDPCTNHFLGIPPGPDYGAIVGSMVGTVLNVVFFAHRQRLSWTASAAPAWGVAPYAAPKGGGVAAAGWF